MGRPRGSRSGWRPPIRATLGLQLDHAAGDADLADILIAAGKPTEASAWLGKALEIVRKAAIETHRTCPRTLGPHLARTLLHLGHAFQEMRPDPPTRRLSLAGIESHSTRAFRTRSRGTTTTLAAPSSLLSGASHRRGLGSGLARPDETRAAADAADGRP